MKKDSAKPKGAARKTGTRAARGMPTSAQDATGPAEAATGTDAAAVPPKPEVTAKAAEKKVSLLTLAADVLASRGEPMGCQEMVEAAIAKGWKTNGKTPVATLSSAILREIAAKGAQARFIKVERGKFGLATK